MQLPWHTMHPAAAAQPLVVLLVLPLDVCAAAGRPRGFGFVVFESPEVVKKVIESKHTIDKRDVECKIAVPKEELAPSAAAADASQKTRKIFVGGLAPTVDDQVGMGRERGREGAGVEMHACDASSSSCEQQRLQPALLFACSRLWLVPDVTPAHCCYF